MANIFMKMQEQQQMAAIQAQQVQAANQINLQNVSLVQQMQAQADAMRAETEKRSADLAAAQAPVSTVVNTNPYSVATGQGTAGRAQEKTTTAPTPQKRPRSTLQLGAEITLPGVGINLGAG